MKNSEDANKYYELVNRYIDTYLEEWKISPKNLKRYLNTNRISEFLERKGLKEIKNIGRVIDDIIQDRISIENDKVLKFEGFKFLESMDYAMSEITQCLHKGINKANIDHEKIIADHYDVSLSEINIVDTNTHKFKIENTEIIIYKEDELEIIKENIKEWAVEKILHDKIKLDLESKKMEIPLSKIIDQEKLKEVISNEVKDIKWVIGSILKCKEFQKDIKYFIGIV